MLDKYLMNKKESNKFPAVMIMEPFLGLEEGTILRFDWSSGKYVSVEENEDLADDYYYSGYAVAIDPYIVKDSIKAGDSLFTFIEQEEESKVEVKPVVVYSDEDAKNQLKTEDELKKEKLTDTESSFPEYTKVHALVVDCRCGHRSLFNTVQAPGINVTIMAEDENSGIALNCPECGSGLKMWFAPDIDRINEPTKEESN